LEVLVDGKKLALGKKERKVGSEAPAVRVKMLNGETKVIGMMAENVQCMITLAHSYDLNESLLNVINKHKEKANIYVVSSSELETTYDEAMSSIEFKDFSSKFGVNIDDDTCAKSIFIINKDGEIEYKEVLADLVSEFDLAKLDEELDAAIKFKKKGHTHENWMGV
jgi:thioredoxin-dependent peroxiredoxin